MGLKPENILPTQKRSDLDQPLQSFSSKPYRPHTNKAYNEKGPRITHDENDEDEIDPEWVDFDPKKDKSVFLGREIPNEATLRVEFEVKRERYLLNKVKRTDPDIEDKMDEMFFQKMAEEGKVVKNIETGGYSDIDLKFEKKQSEIVLKDEVSDDEMDAWIQSVQAKKRSTNEEESKGERKPVQTVTSDDAIIE